MTRAAIWPLLMLLALTATGVQTVRLSNIKTAWASERATKVGVTL